MSFHITVKNCQPISEKLKLPDLYCNVRIGDNSFKTNIFKGKGDVAIWNHSFSAATKESFLKVELWRDGIFQDTFHGDCIINISKYYSTPGMTHKQHVIIIKKSKQIAQINLDIKYVREGYGISNPVQSLEDSMQKGKQPVKLHLQKAKINEKEHAKPTQPTRSDDSGYDMPVPFTQMGPNNPKKTTRKEKNNSHSPMRPYVFNVPFGVGGGGHQQRQQNTTIMTQPSQQNIKEYAKSPNKLPNPHQQKTSEQQQHKMGVARQQPPPHKQSQPNKQPTNQNMPQPQVHAQHQYHVTAPSQSHPYYYQHQQAKQYNHSRQMNALHPEVAVQQMTPPMTGIPPIDMNNLGRLLSGEAMMGMQNPPHNGQNRPNMWNYPNNVGYPAGWGMGWY